MALNLNEMVLLLSRGDETADFTPEQGTKK